MSNLTDFIESAEGGIVFSESGIYDSTKYIEGNQADLNTIVKAYYDKVGIATTLSTIATGTARSIGSMSFDSVNNLLYIYGGYSGTTFLDSLIKYDLTTGTATTLSTTATGTVRYGHSMSFDSVNNLLYIYGGYNGTSRIDDLVKYDLTTGTATTLSTTATGTARSIGSMSFDSVNNLLYIYGGYNSTTFFDDLVKYDLTTGTATTLSTTATGTVRYGHSMSFDSVNNLLYIYGGYNSTTFFDDLVKYDLTTGTATTLSTTATGTARSIGSMSFDSVNNLLYIYGGYNSTTFFDDLVKYDLTTGTATTLSTTATGTVRYGHSMSFDSVNNLLYIYGGYNGTSRVDDLVELQNNKYLPNAKLLLPRIK